MTLANPIYITVKKLDNHWFMVSTASIAVMFLLYLHYRCAFKQSEIKLQILSLILGVLSYAAYPFFWQLGWLSHAKSQELFLSSLALQFVGLWMFTISGEIRKINLKLLKNY